MCNGDGEIRRDWLALEGGGVIPRQGQRPEVLRHGGLTGGSDVKRANTPDVRDETLGVNDGFEDADAEAMCGFGNP